jgi:hypothetical protein
LTNKYLSIKIKFVSFWINKPVNLVDAMRNLLSLTRIISPAPRDAWREIAAADPNCLVFQTPAWMDAICASGLYEEVSRLYEAADGRRWLIPLARLKSSLPDSLVSQESYPAGWGLGGVISSTPLESDQIRVVFTDLARQPVLRTLVRPNPLLSGLWEDARPDGVTALELTSHILDLQGGFDIVWKKRFHHPIRTSIHKAERSNLTVKVDSTGELLPTYYQLFMEWCARRGRERNLPAWLVQWTNRRRDPLERLHRIIVSLDGAGQVYIAYLDGKPVAGAIFLMQNRHAIYLRGTSLRSEAGPVRANDYLQYLMIRAACDADCQFYHMGTSAGIQSLMAFKHGFGAEPTPLFNYSIERLPVARFGELRKNMLRLVENRLLRPIG